MTVSVSTRLSPLYVGNNVNTIFSFTFRVFKQEGEDGISIRLKTADGFTTLDKSLYVVSINSDNLGGHVEFKAPPSLIDYFYIAGTTPADQQLDITNYDNFYPDAIEAALDKLTAILQEWSTLLTQETQARQLKDDQLEQYVKDYVDSVLQINNPGAISSILADIVKTNVSGIAYNQQQFNEFLLDFVNTRYPDINAFIEQAQEQIDAAIATIQPAITEAIGIVGGQIHAPDLTTLNTITPSYTNQGAMLDNGDIYRWKSTPLPGSWFFTGLNYINGSITYTDAEVKKETDRAKAKESILTRAFHFAPYSSFLEMRGFLDVDKNGVIVGGDTVTEKVRELAKFSIKSVKAPYSAYTDQQGFTDVDKNGVILKTSSDDPAPVAAARLTCYYEILSSGNINFVYQSNNKLFRIRFGQVGFNNLPNMIGQDIADYVEDYTQAVWTTIDSSTTDRLPPLVIKSLSGDDGSTTVIYTGGNHGSSGSAGGSQTAANRLYQINIDGKPVSIGTAKSGYCNHINAVIINDIMAYNTITLATDADKYVVRQTFNVDFIAGGFGVDCYVQALPTKSVEVQKDNGPQLVTTGYQAAQSGTQLFLGTNKTRTAFDNNDNSGNKSVNPNAFGVCFKSTNGLMSAYVDKSYGLGDGSGVASNAPLWRGGEGTNYKFYAAVISGSSGYQLLSGSAFYKWRGGYAFNYEANNTYLDSRFAIISEQRAKQALIFTSNLFNITG